MTIEEKLTHFYDTSVEEARRQAEKDVQEHKDSLDAALEEHKKMSLENAASSRKAEIANAKREINKALSAEQLHIRRDWTARQSRLKEKFMESSRYEEYLCTKIEEAVCFAEHDEIQIYLSKEDEPRLKSLTVKTGFPLKLSDESFIGGIKAIIPEKNILIDNSFEEGYQAAYREFKFDGGPAHE